jgi:multidrug efflux pump subunit AcrA (membrane-fusion protein)
MSTALSSALSGLETSLHSCIPSDAELRHLESLLIKAHQAKIEASVAAAHQEAQAQLAAAHAAAQAQLEAQTAAAQAAAAQQISAAVSAQIESITPVTSNQQPVASGQQLAASEPVANEPISASLANEPAANEPISANLANPANEPISANLANEPAANEPISANLTNQAKSVNARYANLNAGLNDRLAFVKSLFGGDDHDYQRVVAYLATLESKAECETFIREAVQPEYDWSKCPDVAERFMHLVYARFE